MFQLRCHLLMLYFEIKYHFKSIYFQLFSCTIFLSHKCTFSPELNVLLNFFFLQANLFLIDKTVHRLIRFVGQTVFIYIHVLIVLSLVFFRTRRHSVWNIKEKLIFSRA